MANYKIYIFYMRGNLGPYCTVFDTQQEAEEWVRNNDIKITKIDML